MRSSEVLLYFHTNCVPVLTLNSFVKKFSNSQIYDCNTINNAGYRIFVYGRWASVRKKCLVTNVSGSVALHKLHGIYDYMEMVIAIKLYVFRKHC